MPANFQFRSPTTEDIPALAVLGSQTFVETFGHLYSQNDLNAFLNEVYDESVVREEFEDPKLKHQVVENQGRLVAYVKIGPVHVPIDNPEPDAMEIWQIYALKEFHGLGLGSKMIAWALDRFRAANASKVYVSVFSENHQVIRIYRHYGFEKIGEYGFPVGEQIDREFIMCLDMKRT